MDTARIAMLATAMQDEHAAAKALAHFMFREIVEDIHAQGKITDAEMKELNKEACNRAELLMEHILPVRDLRMAFNIESIFCNGWDDPEITEELKEREKIYRELGMDLAQLRKS